MSAATSLPGAPDVDEEKKRHRQELVALLGIDSRAIPDEALFWKEVGLRYQTADPKASVTQLANLILSKLGATEDEKQDFHEEEGGRVSGAAYEWLLEYLAREPRSAETGEEEDEDEDSGALASEQQILVSNQDHPIQSIVQFIEDQTIVLDPNWQRGYVWKQRQKRRFIESVLLNLPIPPVLLFQDSRDKKLYVIDGRQRLETVYRFHLGSKKRKESFRTFSAKQPGWEEGKKLHPASNRFFDRLPEEFQRHYNTFVIPARVFMNLPRKTLYEVFKRYNTGSEKLRPAEIRKAVYQGAPLHDMMFTIAGEAGLDKIADFRERELARQMGDIMRNKKARYGAYNFVGRCLAFANLSDEMSVANAINKFMDDFASEPPSRFRTEFVDALETTMNWYEEHDPLCVKVGDGSRTAFHEWVAAVQVVSTMKMLPKIKSGEMTEDKVRETIGTEWSTFLYGSWNAQANDNVGGLLREKQNTTTHWAQQRKWIETLTREASPTPSTAQAAQA